MKPDSAAKPQRCTCKERECCSAPGCKGAYYDAVEFYTRTAVPSDAELRGVTVRSAIPVGSRGCCVSAQDAAICSRCGRKYTGPVCPRHNTTGNAAHQREWVTCPICGEPDMRAEPEGDEDGWIITCTNTACPSNQRVASARRRSGFAWGWRTPFGQRFYGLDLGWFAVGVLLDAVQGEHK